MFIWSLERKHMYLMREGKQAGGNEEKTKKSKSVEGGKDCRKGEGTTGSVMWREREERAKKPGLVGNVWFLGS